MAAKSGSNSAALRRFTAEAADVAEHLHGHDLDVDPAAVAALATNATADGEDPTRTKTLRSQYQAEMYNRFRRVKGLIRETVASNDALELSDSSRSPSSPGVQADPRDLFPFPTDEEKVDAFIEWLKGAEDDEILEVIRRSGGRVSREGWQDVYVRRAYGSGVRHADRRLREAGIALPEDDLAQIFARPVHAETLGLLFTRNFQELQGITDAMDQEISRVLVEGFSQGWNPRRMASEINGRVDAVGLTRARTLARTETIRAHNEAALRRYGEVLGPDAEVTARVEWLTAGDNRVCPICQGLEGVVMGLERARGMIPIHPNCRCAWIPVLRSENAAVRGRVEIATRVVEAVAG